ncbi:unnamed protein product [Fraxinus pennsylvanica]|uniref:Sucrose phosphate synthase n=1 Tax=Fraxinus pennsylvanica TaxID=56036 RepID=A0AAD2E6U5_9LAMI|nr:unnamed protein product [Fraxinus pennsylvanica]
MLSAGSDDADGAGLGESSGAYIVRIPFGRRDKYLPKELLWPHVQEFVNGALDAGDVAALLSGALNVPMVLTGHSLGRNKLEQLLKQGRQSKEDINSKYRIMRRIEAEELSLDTAEIVITSTKQEIEEQWGLYDGFDVKVEKVLRAHARRGVNCHGWFMPRMAALNNGFLVDPHDQQAIADALLKLVSEKNLWNECRRNGLKNIHLFSWPEHCRTYLTRVASCRMRHLHWQTDTSADDLATEESLNDSLKDVQDMSKAIH